MPFCSRSPVRCAHTNIVAPAPRQQRESGRETTESQRLTALSSGDLRGRHATRQVLLARLPRAPHDRRLAPGGAHAVEARLPLDGRVDLRPHDATRPRHVRGDAEVAWSAIRVFARLVSVPVLSPELVAESAALTVEREAGVRLPLEPTLAEAMPVARVERPASRAVATVAQVLASGLGVRSETHQHCGYVLQKTQLLHGFFAFLGWAACSEQR